MQKSTLWALAWVVALLGFIVVAFLASQHDYFRGDLWLTRRIQDIDSEVVARALDYTEDVADWPWLIVTCVAGWLLLRVTLGWQAALLLLVALAARFTNNVIKEIVGRPRPSPSLVEENGQPSSLSFPSGHAEGTLLIWGLLFFFATVYLKNVWLRSAAQALCLWVIIGTGIERVYVGHHWPSDVVGGYWVGGLILAVLILVERLVNGRRGVVAYR